MSQLRIVLCNGEYPPFAGGGGIYTFLLAKGLAEAWPEAQIIVYAGTPEQSFDGKLIRQSTNLLVYYSRKLWDLDYGGSPFLDVIQDFEEIIKLFRPQLIHAHHTMEALLSGMVADKHGIPFILTIQKSPVPDPSKLDRPSWTAVKFCYQRMPYHGVIATSDIYAKQALQLGARQPLQRIYYGIDRKQFRLSPDKRKVTRTALGISDNELLVFCPSRVDDRKGLDVLIEATRIIIQDHPQIRVLIAGKKSPQTEVYYTFLTTLVKEYRLDSVVTIGAEQNTFGRMAELYAAADICVLPSLREGLGIALLEAMATHVPIITTDTVGVTEIVTHNVNGLIIPVGDPTALAEAISSLTADPRKRKQLSSAAVAFMESNGFTYEAMARSHIAFYEEVLSRHRKQSETIGMGDVTQQ